MESKEIKELEGEGKEISGSMQVVPEGSRQLQPVANSPAEMIRMAAQGVNKIPVEDMKAMLELQIKWEENEAKKAFNAAMARVHANIPMVVKTGVNPQTHSKYAALDAIIVKTKDVYTAEGFSVSFYEGKDAAEGCVRICADILHCLGHSITRHYDVPLDGMGIQGKVNMTKIHGKSSSTSYGRRYLMCMIFNIPTGDDNDGNGETAAEELISEEQCVTIDEYLASTNANKIKFLQHLKVEKVADIPESQYQKAINVFEERNRK